MAKSQKLPKTKNRVRTTKAKGKNPLLKIAAASIVILALHSITQTILYFIF